MKLRAVALMVLLLGAFAGPMKYIKAAQAASAVRPARVKLSFTRNIITTDFFDGDAGVVGRPVTIDGPARVAAISKLVVALTPNDWSMMLLGKNWKWLHRIDIQYIWLIFAISYAGQIIDPEMRITGLIFTLVMFGALAFRLYSRFGRRQHSTNKAMT